VNGPSEHLSWAELECRDGAPYPKSWRSNRALVLAMEFEAIRALCGNKPIAVLSAYRTPTHNARVGGARSSQHLQGCALDLAPPEGMTVAAFADVINRRAEHLDSWIRGVGVYDGFVHIDTRESDEVIRWFGSRLRAEGPRKGENE
jgi:hypothetical protein